MCAVDVAVVPVVAAAEQTVLFLWICILAKSVGYIHCQPLPGLALLYSHSCLSQLLTLLQDHVGHDPRFTVCAAKKTIAELGQVCKNENLSGSVPPSAPRLCMWWHLLCAAWRSIRCVRQSSFRLQCSLEVLTTSVYADWGQRSLVLVSTMILSLTASLLFFQNPSQDVAAPDCNETCSQLNETEPEICVVECAELEESGLYVAMVSMVITIPASFLVNKVFMWLRSPVTTAVERDTVTAKSLIQSARDAKKKVLGEGSEAGSKLASMARHALHLEENEGVDWNEPGTEVVLRLFRHEASKSHSAGPQSSDPDGDDSTNSDDDSIKDRKEMLKMNGGAGVDQFLGRARFGLPLDSGLSKKHLRLFFRTELFSDEDVEDLGWAVQSLSKKANSSIERPGAPKGRRRVLVPQAPEFRVLCDGDTLVRMTYASVSLHQEIATFSSELNCRPSACVLAYCST
jgi:hypothetical protein